MISQTEQAVSANWGRVTQQYGGEGGTLRHQAKIHNHFNDPRTMRPMDHTLCV